MAYWLRKLEYCFQQHSFFITDAEYCKLKDFNTADLATAKTKVFKTAA